MRQLKISKRSPSLRETGSESDSLPAPPVTEAEHMTRYITSVARQYQNKGLELACLIEAGEEAWRCAKLHYGENAFSLSRWGAWWVQQRMIQVVNWEAGNSPAAP
jgi:hypothetical protein